MTAPIVLPDWLPTPEQQHERDLALASRFVIYRIAGNAGYDLMRCKRCKQKHPYITFMCEVQPFSMADRGIFGYFHALGTNSLSLSPAERQRFNDAAKLFGPARGLAPLGSSHPETARQLGTQEDEADVGAFPLGVAEEVAPLVAQRLLDRINAKAKPPLVVPGLYTNGKLGVLAPAIGAAR